MIDTHVHLTEKVLYQKIEEVIQNATDSGVEKILCVGMDIKANKQAISLSERFSSVYASVGIHPNSVDRNILDINLLIEQAALKKVVAIGEIGIDLYRSSHNLEKQLDYFKKQLDLALELDLPVIIHSRSSADVIYDVVKDYKGLKGVMHCYSEHPELLNKFIDLGFYISVGGIVTFKNAHIVHDIAKRIPDDKLLIETDAPYLAPMPYRGKVNEPAYVKYTLKRLAELRNTDVGELDRLTTENAYRLFPKLK